MKIQTNYHFGSADVPEDMDLHCEIIRNIIDDWESDIVVRYIYEDGTTDEVSFIASSEDWDYEHILHYTDKEKFAGEYISRPLGEIHSLLPTERWGDLELLYIVYLIWRERWYEGDNPPEYEQPTPIVNRWY